MSRAPSPTISRSVVAAAGRLPCALGATLLPAALLMAPPASAYQLLGSSWDTDRGPSEYALHSAGSDDISDGSDLEAVREAFRKWTCIEGSAFRFREQTDVEGVAVSDLQDGINTVYWDETGADGLGPATLGVNVGNGGGGGARTAADIIFNGFDHTWSTGDSPGADTVDVGSIAIHEIGHWLGLGHACTDQTEAECLPIESSVMAPAYSGGVFRIPQQDDIDGLHAMYELPAGSAEAEASCDGPFLLGEYCSCNDDCVEGLLCVAQDDGAQICSRTCDGDNPDCGSGFNCILGEAPDDGPAPGKCVKGIGGEPAQPGAVCQPNGMCGNRDCTQLGAAGGERVCFQGCQEDDNCPEGYVCSGIACLIDTSTIGIQCPSTGGPDGGTGDDMGGGCSSTDVTDSARWPGALALLALAMWRRRRR